MPILKKISQHKLLLDTHVWLWLAQGHPIFSRDFLQAVELASQHERILVSAISLWEIGMLDAKKRIQFDMDCLDWMDQALNQQGLMLVNLTPRIAVESSRLPDELHGDPADRILVATAHDQNAVLITCDHKLLQYGKTSYVTVFDPQ